MSKFNVSTKVRKSKKRLNKEPKLPTKELMELEKKNLIVFRGSKYHKKLQSDIQKKLNID